jgi:hypothetical protein
MGEQMRYLGKRVAVGAFALMGIGAATLPAAAATLALDFSGTPVSQNDNATIATGYAYNLVTVTTSLSVTGLGEFDNDSTSAISQNGDTVYIGSGSVPSSSNSFLADSLAHVTITTTDSTQLGAHLDWAFASITPLALAAGDYWIAVVYGTPNTPTVFSTSPVNTQSGVSLGTGAVCSQSNACSSGTVTFGPNFEDSVATPLPAALPLFAGGLGLLGFIGRGKKRKASAAIAAA